MKDNEKRALIIILGLILSPFVILLLIYFIIKQPAIIFIPIVLIGALILKKLENKMI